MLTITHLLIMLTLTHLMFMLTLTHLLIMLTLTHLFIMPSNVSLPVLMVDLVNIYYLAIFRFLFKELSQHVRRIKLSFDLK